MFGFFFFCFIGVKTYEREAASELYKELLFYYDKFVRPVKNSTGAVDVKFGASLIRIIDVVSIFFLIFFFFFFLLTLSIRSRNSNSKKERKRTEKEGKKRCFFFSLVFQYSLYQIIPFFFVLFLF